MQNNFIKMKNLILSVAFMLIGSYSFASTKEVKKETPKKLLTQNTIIAYEKQQWIYRCSDGEVVSFECGCSQAQATAMGRSWCNNR